MLTVLMLLSLWNLTMNLVFVPYSSKSWKWFHVTLWLIASVCSIIVWVTVIFFGGNV